MPEEIAVLNPYLEAARTEKNRTPDSKVEAMIALMEDAIKKGVPHYLDHSITARQLQPRTTHRLR